MLAVVDTGSFILAGRALQRHPTTVSKRIQAMEARLGVRLVERTTRQVRITEAGRRLCEKLQAAGDLIREVETEASPGATERHGRLRLAFPAAMGRMWLAPLLPEFLSRYPAVHVEVDYSERFLDLVGDGFDAAVRIGTLSDNRLVARKLGDHQRIVCASPSYLERHGKPARPRDLERHNCLEFPRLTTFPKWRLSDGAEKETVVARGSLRSGDSMHCWKPGPTGAVTAVLTTQAALISRLTPIGGEMAERANGSNFSVNSRPQDCGGHILLFSQGADRSGWRH